jgi:hypothetical protein
MTHAAVQGAVITLQRPAEATNAARRYKIYIDDVKVGAIRVGKTIEIPVAPGRHRIKAKIDWCSSPELIVTVGPGQRAALAVGTSGSILSMLANQIFAPHKYLALTPAQG